MKQPEDNKTIDLLTPQRGRKPLTSTEPVTDVITAATAAAYSRAASQVVALDNAVSAEQIDFSQWVGERLGRKKTADLIKKIADVSDLLELQQIKESRKSKDLRVSVGGKLLTVSTWDDFCTTVVGRSRQHVDDDLLNLKTFGAECLEMTQNYGLGYRQMREMRAIPMDQQAELIEAAKAGDKQTLLDVAESLIERHARDKAEAARQLEEASQVADARKRLLDEKNTQFDTLKERLHRPYKPSKEAAARTAAEKLMLDDLHKGAIDANGGMNRIVEVMTDMAGADVSESCRLAAHNDLIWLGQRLAEVMRAHAIAFDLEAEVVPSWVREHAGKLKAVQS